MLLIIILSILIFVVVVATAHKWCQIVRSSRCCDKNNIAEEGGERCATNVATGVASVTGFVIEATSPTSVRISELSVSPIRKPMHVAQINRLPRKIFREIQQSEQSKICKSRKSMNYSL